MERKIGEIFEYEGEWHQCVECNSCNECAFINSNCTDNPSLKCSVDDRNDNCSVIFKKLEKIGEPFYRRWTLEGNNKLMQRYKTYTTPLITIDKQQIFYNLTDDLLEIEIKQNKEDMEEKKNEELSNLENTGKNLKPFDLEAAKAGKPVCTRNGRKARIICFDVKAKKPIAALITNDDTEEAHFYYDNGRSNQYQEYRYDLMMLPEKHKGWINVIKNQDNYYYCKGVFDTEDHARNNEANYPGLAVATVKIEWEE